MFGSIDGHQFVTVKLDPNTLTPAAELMALLLDRVSHTTANRGVEKVIKATVVTGLHVALVAALVTVTFSPQIETLLPRLQVKVIEERPLPPPPVEKPKPLPASPKPVVRQQREILPPPQPRVMESVAEKSPAAVAPPPPPPPASEAAPAPPPLPPTPAPRTLARFDADYLKNPPPVYPTISRRNSEQGQVMLQVLVSTDGTAKEVRVDRSSGFPRLDEAALVAVRQWRFVPAKRGSEPIEDWVLVPIVFRLAN